MSSAEVTAFLRDFKDKMGIWDIFFIVRDKNIQALADLEITSNKRKEIITSLETKDYSEGPLKETQYGGSEMWVFGKTVKDKEVYIKISKGAANSNTLCISFHIADHPMNYPLK